jgi:aminopeptidase
MQTIKTSDPRLNELAGLALTHSSLELPNIRETGGERRHIVLQGEAVTAPLLLAAQREILKRGHTCEYAVSLPGATKQFYDGSDGPQLSYVPTSLVARINNSYGFFSVLGSEQPLELKGCDSGKMMGLAKSRKFLADMREESPWILVPFPTKAAARLAHMTYQQYTDFLFKATNVDYGQMKENQSALADAINQGSEIVLRTLGPKGQVLELFIGIKGSYAVNHPGKYNIPCGEVFTAPNVKDQLAHGEVYVQDFPAIVRGKRIKGIYLKIESGQVVDFNAKVGKGHLEAIIKADEGSKRLGEIAIGTNDTIAQYHFTEDILFDEKRGGTFHFALGKAFPDCFTGHDPKSKAGRAEIEQAKLDGRVNESGVHVDVISGLVADDPRLGVFVDGKKVVKVGEGKYALAA